MDPRHVTQTPPIEYPTRDGRPMGETDEHRQEMEQYAINVLEDHFAKDPAVYVSGNNFVYYTEGVPADCVSPDAYVVKGAPKKLRDTYKLWEEGGRAPCFALEVTSKSTRSEDLGPKMSKYRDDLHIPEYFLFDLRGDWLAEKLRGFRLVGDLYQPIAAGPGGRLPSVELGLELGVEGRHLRFYVAGATAPLPTRAERAERAEAENARLREEIKRLQGRP